MSKLTVAKNLVTSKAGRSLLTVQKHSPVLLFGAGVVGFVGTVVLASKATLKLEDILDENERKRNEAQELLASKHEDYSASDYAKDMSVLKVRLVRDLGRLYAPTVCVGMVSIAALTGSHVILTRRNAGLMAAYTGLDKAFKEYRERVKAVIGPEKERELWTDTEKREIEVVNEKGEVEKKVIDIPGRSISQYARFFDQTCPSWSPHPDYNLVFVRTQRQYAQDMLHARGHVFLNEVYDSLGIPRSKAGAVVGWVKGNGDDYIDFGLYDETNERAREFVNGHEASILLDFNVDGVIYDLIGKENE